MGFKILRPTEVRSTRCWHTEATDQGNISRIVAYLGLDFHSPLRIFGVGSMQKGPWVASKISKVESGEIE